MVIRLLEWDHYSKLFSLQFKNANAADEKTALMESFLESLWSQLEKCDGSMIWALSTSEAQLSLCRLTVERAVVGRIFVHAMYPNGEADMSRDEVGIKFIWELSKTGKEQAFFTPQMISTSYTYTFFCHDNLFYIGFYAKYPISCS